MNKALAALLAVSFVFESFANTDRGVTTNLVVYTDIHSPSNTSHYYATKLSLAIKDGLIVECNNLGAFDLFNGSSEQDAAAHRGFKLRRRKLLEKATGQGDLSATNQFGRTLSQQESYEKSFDLQSFLGYEFGKKYEKFGVQKLDKKFRLFENVRLCKTALGNLYSVELECPMQNVSTNSMVVEDERIATLLENKFQIRLARAGFEAHSYWSAGFNNENVYIALYGWQDAGRSKNISLEITNKRISRQDKNRKLAEEEKGFKAIDIRANEGSDML